MKILQGEIGWDITLKNIQDENAILINSPGGSLFEGLAMYDLVHGTGKEIGCIGLCASAATLPLMASPSRWGTPNSRYLIHNPSFFIPPSQMTASEMQADADSLQREQNRAVDLYFETLNGTKEEIQNLMNENRVIDANEAFALGLITEIRPYKQDTKIASNNIKSLYNQFKMSINLENEMEKEEVKQELSGIKLMLDKLAKFLFNPKMLVIQDVNGVELDFGASIETVEQIAVGSEATINGQPATGEYILQDGTKYSFENGKLVEISLPEATIEEVINPEVETLKVENEALKAEVQNSIIAAEQMKAKFESEIKSINEKFTAFQNKFSDEKDSINVPPVIDENKKRGFTYKFK